MAEHQEEVDEAGIVNKKSLIQTVSQRTNISKLEVKEVIEQTIDEIIKQLVQGQEVRLVGFGTFQVRSRVSREGRNPQTGEKITIPPTRTPSFLAGKALKDAVKGRI